MKIKVEKIMCCQNRLVLILLTIFSVKGQRWYTASIIENDVTVSKTPNSKEPALNYLPLPIIKPNNRNKSLSEYYTEDINNYNVEKEKPIPYKNVSHTIEVTIRNDTKNAVKPELVTKPITSSFNNTVFHKRLQGVVWFNNTMTNVNVIRNPVPRRKIIRQCPSSRSRKKKQLYPESKGKFLDVFQVVEFQNVVCIASSGLDGVCLHLYECVASGGVSMGQCADGYGTCCVTQLSCGASSKAESGWMTNPGFPLPSTDRMTCSFILEKSSKDVSQIRLDFLNFELLPPNAGTCEQDQFIISGQNINNYIPIICGVNNGQHMYIEVSDSKDAIEINVQTVSEESRLFSIKLKSGDEMAAPKGCLQYYRGEKGILESFNFQDQSTTAALPKYSSYLNNLNYAMCIERATESCSITYTNAGDMQIYNYDIDGLPIIPQEQAGVEVFNCPNDWLLIAAVRVCGDRLNDGSLFQDFSLDAPVTDFSQGPIVAWFRSDGAYIGRGFKLEYTQNPCITS